MIAATHKAPLGEVEVEIPILRSAYAQMRYLAEFMAASEAFHALPVDASRVQSMTAVADIELAAAAGLIRMLPTEHPWRARYDADAYQSADEPWRAMGADLLDALQAAGVGSAAVTAAINGMLSAISAPPSERQVEEASGNSDATPS